MDSTSQKSEIEGTHAVHVRGAGSMKDRRLPFRKDMDLTKPIAVQVLDPSTLAKRKKPQSKT